MSMDTFKNEAFVELGPGVFLGSYNALLHDTCGSLNVKMIVNCGNTASFLSYLDTRQPTISSDVAVVNLDPGIAPQSNPYRQFHSRFNKILQHYLAFFYRHNSNIAYYINSSLGDSTLNIGSPIINGNPLKSLFTLNRLLKLFRNVNTSADIIFVSENFDRSHTSNSLLYALALSYLMDTYDYNFQAACRHLLTQIHGETARYEKPYFFNSQHYDDMLLIDSLKKFYVENRHIKQAEGTILTQNSRLKRSCDHIDTVHISSRIKRIA